MLVTELPEEIGHGVGLVVRAFENVREAPGGKYRRNLGMKGRHLVIKDRSADAGDVWTCEMHDGVVSDCLRARKQRQTHS